MLKVAASTLVPLLAAFVVFMSWTQVSEAFLAPTQHCAAHRRRCLTSDRDAPFMRPKQMSAPQRLSAAASSEDDAELIARRVTVTGDVGGYYRVCVVNEAGKFRRLVGTMTPPDDSNTAEIYVEGKRKMVDGFIRWLKRSKVGLNQIVKVTDVKEEDPTGLYDDFYAKTK